MEMHRVWAMPNKATFTIKPIGEFVARYTTGDLIIIDPFSNGRSATYTNDLNPDRDADYYMDVLDFLKMLQSDGVKADVILFDPPYSPRQISECYEGVGRKADGRTTQRPGRWTEEKDVCAALLEDDGWFLQFGWNSYGMGAKRGFEIEEVLLVSHGAGHNDTICIAERRVQSSLI